MSVLEFIAALVQALAWPSAAVMVGMIFRAKIRELLSSGVKHLKAGPAGLEIAFWETKLAEVRVNLDPDAVELSEEPSDSRQISPPRPSDSAVGKVMLSFAEIEAALIRKLQGAGVVPAPRVGGIGLAVIAAREDLISQKTLRAIEGLAVLRNLVAHGRAQEVGADELGDYEALAEAVIFAIGPPAER